MRKIYPKLVPSCGSLSRSCKAYVIVFLFFNLKPADYIRLLLLLFLDMEMDGYCKIFLLPTIRAQPLIARVATTPEYVSISFFYLFTFLLGCFLKKKTLGSTRRHVLLLSIKGKI
jgi:hypothetical protein